MVCLAPYFFKVDTMIFLFKRLTFLSLSDII